MTLTMALGGQCELTAQSVTVRASEALDFIGEWRLTLDTGLDVIDVFIDIRDVGGQVRAEVLEVGEESADTIDQVLRSGSALVLLYFGQGNSSNPYELTLAPDGADLDVTAVLMGGLFTLEGTAWRR